MESEAAIKTRDFEQFDNASSDNGVKFSDKPFAYYAQALQALQVAFTPAIINEERMAEVLRSSLPVMDASVRSVISSGIPLSQDKVREKLSLEVEPFLYSRRAGYPVQDLPKDNERRLAFQALFLFVLRPHIPLKYEEVSQFVETYPEMESRHPTEQERLRVTANWMDLVFFTLPPKKHKTFLMNLIPRICEGRSARYITGSGETKATADRVNVYRTEGDCVKIQRPPRKRVKPGLPAEPVPAYGGETSFLGMHGKDMYFPQYGPYLEQGWVGHVIDPRFVGYGQIQGGFKDDSASTSAPNLPFHHGSSGYVDGDGGGGGVMSRAMFHPAQGGMMSMMPGPPYAGAYRDPVPGSYGPVYGVPYGMPPVGRRFENPESEEKQQQQQQQQQQQSTASKDLKNKDVTEKITKSGPVEVQPGRVSPTLFDAQLQAKSGEHVPRTNDRGTVYLDRGQRISPLPASGQGRFLKRGCDDNDGEDEVGGGGDSTSSSESGLTRTTTTTPRSNIREHAHAAVEDTEVTVRQPSALTTAPEVYLQHQQAQPSHLQPQFHPQALGHYPASDARHMYPSYFSYQQAYTPYAPYPSHPLLHPLAPSLYGVPGKHTVPQLPAEATRYPPHESESKEMRPPSVLAYPPPSTSSAQHHQRHRVVDQDAAPSAGRNMRTSISARGPSWSDAHDTLHPQGEGCWQSRNSRIIMGPSNREGERNDECRVAVAESASAAPPSERLSTKAARDTTTNAGVAFTAVRANDPRFSSGSSSSSTNIIGSSRSSSSCSSNGSSLGGGGYCGSGGGSRIGSGNKVAPPPDAFPHPRDQRGSQYPQQLMVAAFPMSRLPLTLPSSDK